MHTAYEDADVVVIGETIAEIGPNVAVPGGTFEIDAKRGNIMPGMVDTPPHVADRHARVRSRLDTEPVLRLVLPGARQALPSSGHLGATNDDGIRLMYENGFMRHPRRNQCFSRDSGVLGT
jgi:cytosine/adenosine deaminase-related metal-dependent hydrolase